MVIVRRENIVCEMFNAIAVKTILIEKHNDTDWKVEIIIDSYHCVKIYIKEELDAAELLGKLILQGIEHQSYPFPRNLDINIYIDTNNYLLHINDI